MEPLRIPDFSFDSEVTELVFELMRVRGDLAITDADQHLFDEIRSVQQLITSMTSARIEGNRTTVIDVIREKSASPGQGYSEQVQEIVNLERAVDLIDDWHAQGRPITQASVRALHQTAVEGLLREGDRTPGAYRTSHVSITGARHGPPGPEAVPALMEELVDFITSRRPEIQGLVAMAIVHHRFLWIHPFENGNGRTARLLSYAMLVQQGFTATTPFRALNPTTVFGADRQRYDEMLERADAMTDAALTDWCAYLLGGLLDDLERVRSLGDARFLREEVLTPALEELVAQQELSQRQAEAAKVVLQLGAVKAGDLSGVLPGAPATRSKAIRSLIEAGILAPLPDAPRSYRISLARGPLVVAVIRRLEQLGFVPEILRGAAGGGPLP